MDNILAQINQIIESQKAMIELLDAMEQEAQRQHEELMKLLKGEEA